jgi:beta-lactam-binding protein with PASTA domain
VPLLDGKYEILAEHPLTTGVVRFDATTAEGEPVRVVWYELAAEDEPAFERYRRALRRLGREGVADVLEVVSRPGARYVAWRDEGGERTSLAADGALAARLSEVGLAPGRARVRLGNGGPRIVDLPFGAGVAPERMPAAAAPPEPRRRLAPLSDASLSLVIAGGLLLLAALSWSAGFLLRTNDRLVSVPDPGTVSVEMLGRHLAHLGLQLEPVPLASDEPAGTVLALDPAPGTALRPGRSVRVSYAVPPGRLAPATVPAVLGLHAEVAAARLEAAGLEVGRVARVHEAAPVGVVLAQSLASGSTVGVGSEVDLIVSLGPLPETTFLPRLVGLDEDDARALASVAGLAPDQIVVERVDAAGAEPGTVLSQSLAAYRRVLLDDAVLRLLVASAASTPAGGEGLPNLAGLSEAAARALAPGFEVRVSYLEDSSLPSGVVWQSLRPGAERGAGPLELTLNVRPVVIPVPTVEALVRRPQLRELPYLWYIEPGIPEQTARVTAVTLDGERRIVRVERVRGGERLEGAWRTTHPGPVRFQLTLNHQPYGEELLLP